MSWFISEMTAVTAQLRRDGVASSPLGPTVFPGRFVVLIKHFDPHKSSQHLTARAFSWNFWTLRQRKQVLAPRKSLGQHHRWGPSRRERHRDRCKSGTAWWFRLNCPAQNLVRRCQCVMSAQDYIPSKTTWRPQLQQSRENPQNISLCGQYQS